MRGHVFVDNAEFQVEAIDNLEEMLEVLQSREGLSCTVITKTKTDVKLTTTSMMLWSGTSWWSVIMQSKVTVFGCPLNLSQ